jgi:hypothetical protein
VKYEQGFHIPEDDILHSHRRENLNLTLLCYMSVIKGILEEALSQYKDRQEGAVPWQEALFPARRDVRPRCETGRQDIFILKMETMFLRNVRS